MFYTYSGKLTSARPNSAYQFVTQTVLFDLTVFQDSGLLADQGVNLEHN